MYKKAGCTSKVVVLLVKPIVFWVFFWRSRYRPRRWILTSLLVSSRNRMAQRRGRQNACVCDKRDRTITCVFVAKFNKYNCVLIFTKRSFKRKLKFGGNCFQTELLSRLSHKVFRLLPSTVPLRKFTINIISNSIINLLYWNVYNTFTAVFLVGDLKNQPGL